MKNVDKKVLVHSMTADPDNNNVENSKGAGREGTQSLSKYNCTTRESVSPWSRLIIGFRNKYH